MQSDQSVIAGTSYKIFRVHDYGSPVHTRDRDEAALSGKGRPNGIGDGRNCGKESDAVVVVDRDYGNGRMRLLLRHAFVGGHESRETAALRHGQELVVAQRTPVVEHGGFDQDPAELVLEWLA